MLLTQEILITYRFYNLMIMYNAYIIVSKCSNGIKMCGLLAGIYRVGEGANSDCYRKNIESHSLCQ